MKRFSKALLGHFKKSGGRACRVLKEVVVSEEAVQSVSLGDEFGLEIFDGVSNVDICGISKGKGFQGVMKNCLSEEDQKATVLDFIVMQDLLGCDLLLADVSPEVNVQVTWDVIGLRSRI